VQNGEVVVDRLRRVAFSELMLGIHPRGDLGRALPRAFGRDRWRGRGGPTGPVHVQGSRVPRDKAIERLLAVVRRRPAEDIDVVSDIAERIFVRAR
jgi:hypothetical protein